MFRKNTHYSPRYTLGLLSERSRTDHSLLPCLFFGDTRVIRRVSGQFCALCNCTSLPRAEPPDVFPLTWILPPFAAVLPTHVPVSVDGYRSSFFLIGVSDISPQKHFRYPLVSLCVRGRRCTLVSYMRSKTTETLCSPMRKSHPRHLIQNSRSIPPSRHSCSHCGESERSFSKMYSPPTKTEPFLLPFPFPDSHDGRAHVYAEPFSDGGES